MADKGLAYNLDIAEFRILSGAPAPTLAIPVFTRLSALFRGIGFFKIPPISVYIRLLLPRWCPAL